MIRLTAVKVVDGDAQRRRQSSIFQSLRQSHTMAFESSDDLKIQTLSDVPLGYQNDGILFVAVQGLKMTQGALTYARE